MGIYEVDSIGKKIHAKKFSGVFCGQKKAEFFGEDKKVNCWKCNWNIRTRNERLNLRRILGRGLNPARKG